MKNLKACLAAASASAVFALTLPAHALDQGAILSKLDVSRSGVFEAVAPASDLPAAPDVIGAPASAKPLSGPAVLDNGRAQPDWSFTPGHLCTADDSDFLEYRYPEHIPYCKRDVTGQMKEEVAAHYGIPKSEWGNYEFDHLIPLCIGGNSHVDNLWPQPRGNPNGSDDKDKLENQLYQEMKAGTITQAEAVKQIFAWFGPNAPDRVLPKAAARPAAN